MHKKDIIIQLWRPFTAVILVLGWICMEGTGHDVSTAYQALTVAGVGGLGVDRAMWKRRQAKDQIQAGDPKDTVEEIIGQH